MDIEVSVKSERGLVKRKPAMRVMHQTVFTYWGASAQRCTSTLKQHCRPSQDSHCFGPKDDGFSEELDSPLSGGRR